MRRKFAFIGAGSLDFTRDLARDLLTFEAFQNSHFVLMDIDERRLQYAKMGLERIIKTGGYPATVECTSSRREALHQADGVLITILQGGVQVWRKDIEIPMKYGVDICVGDTRGPAGIFRFLRTAPVLLEIAKDIEALCPNAIVLNYTNPMAMLVSFLKKQSKINVTGLCHSVQDTASMLARWIGAEKSEVSYLCAGINHQAFYLNFQYKGQDAYPLIRAAIRKADIAKEEQLRIEMYKQLDYFPTESSGHNSEYLPWFRKRADLLQSYCQDGTGWNPGHHAYILKKYLSRENTWEKDYLNWLEQGDIDLERGYEYAACVMNALIGDHQDYTFNANLINEGHIKNIENGVCVEVPVTANEKGLIPQDPVTLPPQLSILINNTAKIENLAVEAAIEKNARKVFHAILFDPLSSSVCSMEEIHSMVQEMLYANKDYLGYLGDLNIAYKC